MNSIINWILWNIQWVIYVFVRYLAQLPQQSMWNKYKFMEARRWFSSWWDDLQHLEFWFTSSSSNSQKSCWFHHKFIIIRDLINPNLLSIFHYSNAPQHKRCLNNFADLMVAIFWGLLKGSCWLNTYFELWNLLASCAELGGTSDCVCSIWQPGNGL